MRAVFYFVMQSESKFANDTKGRAGFSPSTRAAFQCSQHNGLHSMSPISETVFRMKSQIFGAIGIALGLVAFLIGLGQRSDLGGILLIGGIFLFGCGLVAAAIGANK